MTDDANRFYAGETYCLLTFRPVKDCPHCQEVAARPRDLGAPRPVVTEANRDTGVVTYGTEPDPFANWPWKLSDFKTDPRLRAVALVPEMIKQLRTNLTDECESMGCQHDDGGPLVLHVPGCPFYDVLASIYGDAESQEVTDGR